MRLLLDTHVLLWAAGDAGRIPAAVRELLEDESSSLHFSSASVWEIVIKRALGRPDFRVDPIRLRRLLVANGWGEVPVTSDHALAVEALPPLHKDPFDRILLAQARTERLRGSAKSCHAPRCGSRPLSAPRSWPGAPPRLRRSVRGPSGRRRDGLAILRAASRQPFLPTL